MEAYFETSSNKAHHEGLTERKPLETNPFHPQALFMRSMKRIRSLFSFLPPTGTLKALAKP
jgi:hypothetical protein